VRSERFYYDGIRRIQELVTDPVLNQGAAGQSGDPELENLAGQGEEGSDPEGAPGPLEEGQLEGDPENGGGGGGGGGGAIGWTPSAVLAREYIWGPGDSYAGVDELLVQFGEDRKPWWVIQDGGGDVVAVIKAPGTSPSSTQPVKVCGQWTYNAYGAVHSFDLLATHPAVHCGHKGLFFDRLDVGVAEIGGGGAVSENDRLEPGAELSGYVRGRHYSPRLGRFLQQDPNATAMVLISSAAHSGRGIGAVAAAFDLMQSFDDGANLYQYLRGSPWGGHDALGLQTDPFDMVNDFAAARASDHSTALRDFGRALHESAAVWANVITMLPIPIVASSGEIALWLLGKQGLGATAAWAAIDLVPFAKLGLKNTKWGVRIAQAIFGSAKGGKRASLVGHTMKYGKGVLTVTAEAAEHVGKIKPFNEAKKVTQGMGHVIEAHHLIPERYLNLVPGVGRGAVPAVVLTYEEHQAIEAVIRAAEQAQGVVPDNPRRLWDMLKEAYRNESEYLDAISGFFQ